MTDRGGDRPEAGARREDEAEPVPLGQRLLDRPFLLLIAGVLVMFLFFTGWGALEITSLTPAPLP